MKEIVESALEAKETIAEMEALIALGKEKGIDVSGSERILKLAILSLERNEFMEALSRVKESQVTYALEVKGEIGSFSYYIKNKPKEISLSALFLILFAFTTFKVTQMQLLRNKIKKLKNEEKLFQQLMKVVQNEVFFKKTMSIEEYETSMKYYETRLSEVIEGLIECENKRIHALRFSSGQTRLKQERERLIELIKGLQKEYLKEGKIETKAYELRLESYNKRLGAIDEQFANLEAKQAMRKKVGFIGLFARR